MNVPATRTPSNYPGVFVDTMSNEYMNVQNQEENRNAREGTSREFQIAVDNDGLDIDLNLPPKSV